LCSPDAALRLPTYVTARVVVGHYASSPETARAREEVRAFFGGDLTVPEMAEMMQRYDVDWVFLTPHEDRAILARIPALGFEVVFEDGGYTVLAKGSSLGVGREDAALTPLCGLSPCPDQDPQDDGHRSS
jgi:hypothetical protein